MSFTAHGPGILRAGSHAVRLSDEAARVELARGRRGWLLAVGERKVGPLAQRPALHIEDGEVTDRQTGGGTVALLAARLLAREVHPSWLPGPLKRSGAWMRGMPAAALWRMGELDGRRRATWWRRAAAATLQLRGGEQADTHDVGFLYGESAAYGYDVACRDARRPRLSARRCRALKASARAAADRIALMIRANAPARMLPNHLQRCPDCPSGARETVIDSMMNVGLLAWAERHARRTGYSQLAAGHAHAVAGALIRPDGCSAQAVFTDRITGRTFGLHTHQGLSAGSTWARGQAWALLGYARLARDMRDAWAAGVARALAGCWLRKAPRSGPVRFDLDATAGPPDSSAQAAAAAGLATLALVDRARRGSWRAAARTQLESPEGLISAVPPLGRLGGQTYVAGGDRSDENVELPVGALYVLDARARLAG
jgi:unsaturated chondroitin disaccharide hydrolase